MDLLYNNLYNKMHNKSTTNLKLYNKYTTNPQLMEQVEFDVIRDFSVGMRPPFNLVNVYTKLVSLKRVLKVYTQNDGRWQNADGS